MSLTTDIDRHSRIDQTLVNFPPLSPFYCVATKKVLSTYVLQAEKKSKSLERLREKGNIKCLDTQRCLISQRLGIQLPQVFLLYFAGPLSSAK